MTGPDHTDSRQQTSIRVTTVPVPVLLAAVRNALHNGSYMTGANLAFLELCDALGIDEDTLPPFDPQWARADRERRADDLALVPRQPATGETT